jgi:PAS domain S-box-containing protein
MTDFAPAVCVVMISFLPSWFFQPLFLGFFFVSSQSDHLRNSMAYSLAMASPEGNKYPPLTRQWNAREREQVRISTLQSHHMRSPRFFEMKEQSHPHHPIVKQPASLLPKPLSLPKTLQDALRPTSRAIVVTETSKPFRVLNVNKAWEDLCGYTYLESKGRSLGSLLKGIDTDQVAVTAMINQLLRGEEAMVVLTNYTKEGRKFRNRLHVGPLYDDDSAVPTADSDKFPKYFVGILKEV